MFGDTTHKLLEQAGEGDGSARHELLGRYRDQLRRFIAARLDRRIAHRVDASDLVQETLAEAGEGMDAYLRERPITFIGWLRRLARDRVIDARRYHLDAQRRSVNREQPIAELASDDSTVPLINAFSAPGRSPSGVMGIQDRLDEVATILDTLRPRDREILMMWHVEQKSMLEMARTLGLTAHGVKKRHLRALMRLRERLESTS
jgi:RNA polymerase sigma-70 factor, ECF subfamily